MNIPENVLAPLKEVKTKKFEIRKVRSWEVGVTKSTLVKFNLPYETRQEQEEAHKLVPFGLRRGNDRRQDEENQRHIDYAVALGKPEKTVSEREGNRPVDTADEKMETPLEGQATARYFWADLHGEGFRFLDGEYFVRTKSGRTSLVIELRFVHDKALKVAQAVLKASGITPTPFSFKLREELVKRLFSRRWHRCVAFSNSAHADPTKTYNFFGEGRRGQLWDLRCLEGGTVRFTTGR